jgi:hypothetical protein
MVALGIGSADTKIVSSSLSKRLVEPRETRRRTILDTWKFNGRKKKTEGERTSIVDLPRARSNVQSTTTTMKKARNVNVMINAYMLDPSILYWWRAREREKRRKKSERERV